MNRSAKPRGYHRKRALILFLILALAVAAYLLVSRYEQSNYPEQRGEMDAAFAQLPTREDHGITYQLRPNLTSILFIGYDKQDDAPSVGYRNGGQSDFLMLAVIDHREKKIHRLHIERDTMTDVAVLGVTGRPAGMNKMQICLSHGFGATLEENNKRTVETVSRLLEDVQIDFYVDMDIRAIAAVNDALGGVEVTIEDDFSAFDASMTPGTTMTLHGKQAQTFLRTRRGVGDSTNKSRMRRHQAYMNSAIELFRRKMEEDGAFLSTFLDCLDGVVDMSISRGRLINELNQAYGYDIQPVKVFAGEYMVGKNGFMEFHVEEEDIRSWVLSTYYREKKD